jgi:hypothetical protein
MTTHVGRFLRRIQSRGPLQEKINTKWSVKLNPYLEEALQVRILTLKLQSLYDKSTLV